MSPDQKSLLPAVLVILAVLAILASTGAGKGTAVPIGTRVLPKTSISASSGRLTLSQGIGTMSTTGGAASGASDTGNRLLGARSVVAWAAVAL